MNKNTVMLVDGHGLVFRAFYAVPELSGPDGTPTNAIHGFFNMFLKIKKDWNPDDTVVVFDAPGKTFRNDLYCDYKKGRKPTPDELKIQIPILQEILRSLGIPVMSIDGVEADDVVGSLAREYMSKGDQSLIVTSDKDILQVLAPGIKILRPGKSLTSFREWDSELFKSEYGFVPERMADYLALVGDKVDNVPGVPGVGDKTAKKLLATYGDLEGILDHTGELKPAQRKKFDENRDNVRLSLELTTLKLGAYRDLIEESNLDKDVFISLCNKYGLKSIQNNIDKLTSKIKTEPVVEIEESVMDLSDLDSYEDNRSEECVLDLSHPLNLIPVDVKDILLYDRLAVHIKWSGSYPMGLNVDEICLYSKDGSYWTGDAVPEGFEEWLEAGRIITSDYKRFVCYFGLPDPKRVWDFRTAHYLIHPDGASHDLATLFEEMEFEVDEHHGAYLWRIMSYFDGLLNSRGLKELMVNLDLPLIPVLVEMEKSGVKLDRQAMEKTVSDLEDRLGDIRNTITDLGGVAINLNSPKQVGQLLFEVLKLPPIKKTKTGYSTNVTVLEKLASFPEPDCTVPKLLLEYRELSKMLSGFAVPLIKSAGDDDIIHSTFESDTTGTGRLSSRDPNLQNLPVYGEWSERIRKALIPKKEGCCFVAADYSQVELRVLAHICGEAKLIDIFKSDRDIHTETAAMVFGVEPDFVTKELRRYAKTVSFGLLYGMSVFGLASRLEVSRGEAKDIIDKYFKALPGVESYISATYDEAMGRGYTKTLTGRIRPLEEVVTGNSRDTGHIKRVAVNSPIQGTASDIAKEAMIVVNKIFSDDEDVSMVLQVHDSIVCECPEERKEEVLKKLTDAMEAVATLNVPLKTDSKSGFSLADV